MEDKSLDPLIWIVLLGVGCLIWRIWTLVAAWLDMVQARFEAAEEKALAEADDARRRMRRR